MTMQETVTLGIAVLGAALGIFNSWHSFQKSRVKLRVTPKWSIAHEWSGLAIEVVNFSNFPVTIDEVGFTLSRTRSFLPKRVLIPQDAIVHGGSYPRTLQPREVLDIVFAVDWLRSLHIHKAYALTASGEIARGTSGALRQFRHNGNRPI